MGSTWLVFLALVFIIFGLNIVYFRNSNSFPFQIMAFCSMNLVTQQMDACQQVGHESLSTNCFSFGSYIFFN
jgi:hypothetical protein